MTDRPDDAPHDDLSKKLDDIAARLQRLEWQVRYLQHQAQPPRPAPLSPIDRSTPGPQRQPAAPQPAPAPSPTPASTPQPKVAPPVSAGGAPPATPAPIPAQHRWQREPDRTKVAPPKPRINIEQFLGLRGLLYAGIAAVLLGTVFFLKYAEEQGWISPVARVLSGAAAGLALIGLAEWTLFKGKRYFAAALMGTGVVVLYLMAWSSTDAYFNLIDRSTAFVLMTLITGLGIALSAHSRLLPTAMVALVGAVATPVMVSSGQNEQLVLLVYLGIVAAGFLALSLARRWNSLGPVALAGVVVLFGGWMLRFDGHVDSSPAVSTVFAWSALVLFALWSAVGRRLGRLNAHAAGFVFGTAVALMAVCVHALHNPVDHLLGGQLEMLLLAVAVVSYGLVFRAGLFAVLASLPVAFAFTAWTLRYLEDTPTMSGYAVIAIAPWAMVLGVLAAMTRWGDRLSRGACQAVVAVLCAGVALRLATLPESADLAAPMMSQLVWFGHVQLIALNALLLAWGFWRRLSALRYVVFAWTALILYGTYSYSAHRVLAVSPDVFTSIFCWLAAALLLAEVLAEAALKRPVRHPGLVAGLAVLTLSSCYAATYRLLRVDFRAWMGLYTLCMALLALGVSLALFRWRDRRRLAFGLLGASLVLLSLAAPVQFDYSAVTVAWSAQVIVSMVIARKLGSRLLVVKAILLLTVAVYHFQVMVLPHDDSAQRVLLTVLEVPLSYALALVLSLTAAGVTLAALLPRDTERLELLGNAAEIDRTTARLCIGGVMAAFCVWNLCALLPPVAATWWLLTLAGAALGVGLWRKVDWPVKVAMGLLGFLTAKWLVYDTLALRVLGGPDLSRWVGLNFMFAAGAVLTALGALVVRHFRETENPGVRAALNAARVVLALLVLWSGCFEIDRFFAAGATENADLGRQMGYSIWWALNATVLLAVGFVYRRKLYRLVGLAVFAVTCIKVVTVDMKDIHPLYRIASFIGVGLLLVAASWLYYRFFDLPDEPREGENQTTDERG